MKQLIVRIIPAVAWMAFIFFMSSQEQFPSTLGVSIMLLTVVGHMVLYGVLGLLLLFAFAGTARPSRTTMAAAVLGAALYGVTDEFHQSFVPGRDASVFDLFVNTVGATLAVISSTFARSTLTSASSR
ncbi:MAG TPA: VanZ family protein [Thermomicrobiales bacterium]|nr:VanZ family protein [Thermomicrobiales bacterium]